MDQPISASAPAPRVRIRPYRPEDRDVVRAICADTGFLGKPIDPVFEDRELFADYLTAYYTDVEPDLLFLCEVDGVVKGYAMGSRFPKKKEAYEKRSLPILAARGLWRLITRPYKASTRRYVWWVMTKGRDEVPLTPPNMPHFHFNMLPSGRSVANTRMLVDSFFEKLASLGEKKVYGQVVTYETRRGRRLFEGYGFEVVDTREVTKYRAIHPGKIHLFTIIKDLEANSTLYGKYGKNADGSVNVQG